MIASETPAKVASGLLKASHGLMPDATSQRTWPLKSKGVIPNAKAPGKGPSVFLQKQD